MNKTRHQKAVDILIQVVEEARIKLTKSTLPPQQVCREAIAGIVAKRGKNVIRRSMPVFRENPLGNLLFRLIQFHRSSGGIMGAMMVDGDCSLLVRALSDRSGWGAYWTDQKSKLFDHAITLHTWYMTPPDKSQLYDELDTLALVLLGGQSQAADNWQRALNG